jgi:hypothetical protein
MALESNLQKRIARDVFVSLFIYALPVALLFGWFAYKGEKPWLKPAKSSKISYQRRF